jgi:hypothetical protein
MVKRKRTQGQTTSYKTYTDPYRYVSHTQKYHTKAANRIGSVMVGVLASNAVDREFEPRSGQTKEYKIGICCFSAKHTSLRSKNKDRLNYCMLYYLTLSNARINTFVLPKSVELISFTRAEMKSLQKV